MVTAREAYGNAVPEFEPYFALYDELIADGYPHELAVAMTVNRYAVSLCESKG